jgi:hypothetical protein
MYSVHAALQVRSFSVSLLCFGEIVRSQQKGNQSLGEVGVSLENNELGIVAYLKSAINESARKTYVPEIFGIG